MVKELGFPREESSLALFICKNDLEEAINLLTSGGSDLPALQALAMMAGES
jgi:uncharacterized UBP type Zn finger protein